MTDRVMATTDMREQPEPPPARFRHVLYVVGAVMIFIGLKGVLHDDRHYENPSYWARLFIGGALVHDLVIVPVVTVISVALTRLIHAPYRGPIQLGLFASAVFAFVAYPGVRRFSSAKDNTSADPLNYAHGVLVCLAVVWALVLAVEVRLLLRQRGRNRG